MSAYVPARQAPECSHGHPGYCHDDALPEEREAVASLHRAAFAWALHEQADADVAESFATWAVADRWSPGSVYLDGNLAYDWRRYESLQQEAA